MNVPPMVPCGLYRLLQSLFRGLHQAKIHHMTNHANFKIASLLSMGFFLAFVSIFGRWLKFLVNSCSQSVDIGWDLPIASGTEMVHFSNLYMNYCWHFHCYTHCCHPQWQFYSIPLIPLHCRKEIVILTLWWTIPILVWFMIAQSEIDDSYISTFSP